MSRWYLVGFLSLIAISYFRISPVYDAYGVTYDEPFHLGCGLAALSGLTDNYSVEQPPISKLPESLAFFLGGVRSYGLENEFAEGLAVLTSRGRLDKDLAMARRCGFFFVVIAAVAIFGWTREMFGTAPAFLALLLYTLLPTVLANAALATTDHPFTAMLTLAFWAIWRWQVNPRSLGRAAIAGLAVGLAVATKFSAIPFLAAGLLLAFAWQWILRKRADEEDANEADAFSLFERGRLIMVSVALCFIAIWAAYMFESVPLRKAILLRDWAATLPPGETFTDFANAALDVPIPAGRLLFGLYAVAGHARDGHPAYLFGMHSVRGWWYFFPIALAIKTPIPFLVLALTGAWQLLRRSFARNLPRLAMPVIFAAGILLACMASTLNLGTRHILPIYPLLAMMGGWAICELWRWRSAPFVYRGALAAMLAWLVWNSVDAQPRYLSWFNELAPADPSAALVGSDLDWGQDLKSLGRVLRERRIPAIALYYFGKDRPEYYYDGVVKEYLAETSSPEDWVAISVSWLRIDPSRFRALKDRPFEMVGDSIRLYPPRTGVRPSRERSRDTSSVAKSAFPPPETR